MNFEETSSKEYLLTNGIGGYCSSTFSGANTRRYHGILVASFDPPTDRMVLVSKIEETLVIDTALYNLSSNQYPGVIYPEGYRFIESFECDTKKVVVVFNVNDHRLKKTISVVEGENTPIVSYQNLSSFNVSLQLMPLLVYRDFHALFYQGRQFDFFQESINDNYFKIYATYGAHPLFIKFTKGYWKKENDWYRNIQYKKEKERGFPFEEDSISIGKVFIDLEPNEEVQIIFSTDEISSVNTTTIENKISDDKKYPSFINDLIKSSRQFIVNRNSTGGKSIIAGYHWFADWGRDTMIALRGISIATGNQAEAKSILQTFLSVIDEGMLPNRFPDYTTDNIEYGTIDATLWLFIALYEYYLKFDDHSFIKQALPKLKEIIEWHKKGTRFNIHVTSEGLLYGGENGYQLTWMDAKANGIVITPRIGCAVETNALWYNTLHIYQFFVQQILNESENEIDQLIEKCGQSFVHFFMNEKEYLNDVIIPGDKVDDSIRPNQIYSISLPFSPLNKSQQKKVLNCVTTYLLTPYGLRTLNADNPEFKALYTGNGSQRDNAYHQGMVWPFLWGEWALSFLKQNDFDVNACKFIWEQSSALQNHFYNDGCSMAIAEIFDGLQPTTGKGCVQQAWSVGMLLAVFLHKDFKWSFL